MTTFERGVFLSTLPAGRSQRRLALVVVLVSGAIFLVLAPFARRPLGQGMLSGHEVMCPWHAWTWDVRSGENTANPSLRIPSYEVKIEGGDVLVRLPD